jgi:hypothetical protein
LVSEPSHDRTWGHFPDPLSVDGPSSRDLRSSSCPGPTLLPLPCPTEVL